MQIDMDLADEGKLPALWSAEEPHLYILVLTLLGKDGEHLDSESTQVHSAPCPCTDCDGAASAGTACQLVLGNPCGSECRLNCFGSIFSSMSYTKSESACVCACFSQVGLRQVVVEGRQLLVNRRPIMIKGVNRHEHDERRGKAVTEEGMLADVLLLKQLNFNAVRCSHYPNATRWCAGPGCWLSHSLTQVFRWTGCYVWRSGIKIFH